MKKAETKALIVEAIRNTPGVSKAQILRQIGKLETGPVYHWQSSTFCAVYPADSRVK